MKLDISSTKCFLIFVIIINLINNNYIKSLRIKASNKNLLTAVDLIDLFQQQNQNENEKEKTSIKTPKNNKSNNSNSLKAKNININISNNPSQSPSENINNSKKFMDDIKEIISNMGSYRSYIEAAIENLKNKKIEASDEIIFQSIDNKKKNLIQEKSKNII